MTEIPKPRPLAEHELVNFWYAFLNQDDPEDTKAAFDFGIAMTEEDGYTLPDLVSMSENSSTMVRSMCYDVLKKANRKLTEEQENFLKENRWQNEFWRQRKV